jgi:hypothetical protein
MVISCDWNLFVSQRHVPYVEMSVSCCGVRRKVCTTSIKLSVGLFMWHDRCMVYWSRDTKPIRRFFLPSSHGVCWSIPGTLDDENISAVLMQQLPSSKRRNALPFLWLSMHRDWRYSVRRYEQWNYKWWIAKWQFYALVPFTVRTPTFQFYSRVDGPHGPLIRGFKSLYFPGE